MPSKLVGVVTPTKKVLAKVDPIPTPVPESVVEPPAIVETPVVISRVKTLKAEGAAATALREERQKALKRMEVKKLAKAAVAKLAVDMRAFCFSALGAAMCAAKSVFSKVVSFFQGKKEWPMLGGSGALHPMAGPWPKTPTREQWTPPEGWTPPSKPPPVGSWFDAGKRLVPAVNSWFDIGARLS